MKRVSAVISCLALGGLSVMSGCTSEKPGNTVPSFAEDVAFMEKHTDIVLLQEGGSALAVAPAYQCRVMTSTYDMEHGPSLGWINRPVIEQGMLSAEDAAGKLQEHIYVFGGEERFWIGPEGGQFAVYFEPGAEFVFDNWHTPTCINTDEYKIRTQDPTSVTCSHEAQLVNWTGTKFDILIVRTVSILESKDIEKLLGVALPEEVKVVAYATDNRITNIGHNEWTQETGMLSVWLLGMYPPSSGTTVVIPFRQGPESDLGPVVNDAYFGKIPSDYLKLTDDCLFLKGDGTRRGKIGISPKRSLAIAGSFNSDDTTLNLVICTKPEPGALYVNSMWEMQDEPFSGDMINAYNDGPTGPGQPPLGPFYELETSSPAGALKPGETLTHVQNTIHIKAPREVLDELSKKLLGAGVDEIEAAF